MLYGKNTFFHSILNVREAAFILYKSEKSNKLSHLFSIW